MSVHSHSHAPHEHARHEHSLWQELLCHWPYAVFSVALSFILLSILHFFSGAAACGHAGSVCCAETILDARYYQLFHVLHYTHLLFASVGTVVTFRRFSTNVCGALLIGFVSPAFFCTLSDVALPAVAAQVLGISVPVHVCFFSLADLMNAVPFMLAGVVTGFALTGHYHDLSIASLRSHFVHILISSLAASCYTMSYGFNEWTMVMGMLFFLLIGAVVLPCTVSDVVVPMFFARWKIFS